MKQTINEKSYALALDKILEKISKRTITLDEKHILIVPDVYTFTLEKRLFLQGKGSFDLEVTTFNRIYSRIIDEGNVLSKQGAIMLVKNVCRKNADKLTCYTRSALKTGFAVKLYDAISTLRACAVTPDEVDAVPMPKSKDVALLYREYLKATEGKYVDASGRNKILTEEFSSTDYLKNAHVYVALYDVFTADVKKLLSVIEKKALSLTVATADEMPSTFKVNASTEVYACADSVSQYKEIAKKIKSFVRSGGRYGDVRVVSQASLTAPIKRIFDEYGIPYYAGEKIALLGSELARFILSVCQTALRKYRTDDMLALCGNYYSGIEKSDADAFRTYVLAKSVDYRGFERPFAPDDKTPADVTEGAERTRVKLMQLSSLMDKAFTSAEKYASMLEKLLVFVSAKEKTEELEKIDGRNLSQIYDKTLALISLMGEMNEGEEVSGEDLVEILKEGFEGSEISLVPNSANTVQIGPVAQFRGERPIFAVLADFNEGVLPARITDDGLLSDADADKMESYRLTIEPKTERKNLLCRGELWHFLQASKKIFITYVDNDDKKISYDLKLLCAKNGVEIKDADFVATMLTEERDASVIATLLGTEEGAMESVLLDRNLSFTSSVLEAVSEDKRAYFYGEEKEDEPIDKAVFMRGKTTSVSALQTYFSCPYKYFLSYALRLKKKDEGKVSVIDIGSFLHKIAEDFIRDEMPKNVEEYVKETVKRELVAFEKYSYEQNAKVFERITKEAITLCSVIRHQINAGEFKPAGVEVPFGKEKPGYKPLNTVVLPSGIRLNGEIDRYDVYKKYARVVDYKTGSTKFSYSDLYYGQKIQLAVYMQVLIENGFKPVGMFYLPLYSSWTDTEYTNRLNGPYEGSIEMILLQDGAVLEGGKSTVLEVSSLIKKDGTLSIRNNSKQRTGEELQAICDYAEKVASQAVEEILAGNVKPSPSTSGQHTSCDYCDYCSICGRRGEVRTCDSVDFDAIYEAVTGKKPLKKEEQ